MSFLDIKTNVCFITRHRTKIIANASCRAYYHLPQVGDTTQALASSAMPILPLLKTAAFDPEATKTLASAFDSAWSVLKRSGSTLAADENAIVTREVLAKCIIAMGRTGERNQHRLMNDALAHVANSKLMSRERWPTAGQW
jgi:hypothetical protein